MEALFNITTYRPTRPPAPGTIELPSEEVAVLAAQLQDQTRNISKYPYDADNWTRRADTLSRLRYPELAVGDANKATLLFRAHYKNLKEARANGSEWRLGHRIGFWMLDPTPRYQSEDLFDETEYNEQLEQYLRHIQRRISKIEKRNLLFTESGEEGRFRRRMYPWTHAQHRRRADTLVSQMNKEFQASAERIGSAQPACAIWRDAFGVPGSDVLGVFATRHIRKGETVLLDHTNVWGANYAYMASDNETLNTRIDHSANDQMQQAPLDLSWIRDEVGKQAGPVLLNCRLLLAGINDDAKHPLDHHLVARLTPTYHEDKIEPFVLLNDIIIPNKALQTFGIDIFANQNYDTWVLLTIQARIQNNSCGDPSADSLFPPFSLFNHSCDPNVEWNFPAGDHKTIVVKARRSIKLGEQMLVKYDQIMRDQPLAARRKRIYRWLDGPCMCTRCIREEEESKHQVPAGRDWDDSGEEVVFPEDLLK